MSEALRGRLAQRQALMAKLCDSLGALTRPRVTLEASGGKGIAVLLDEGRGGAMLTRAAPWLPKFTAARDLTLTARGVAGALHAAVTDQWSGTTRIGPRTPRVTRRDTLVAVQFFGVDGDALPIVEVPLTGT